MNANTMYARNMNRVRQRFLDRLERAQRHMPLMQRPIMSYAAAWALLHPKEKS